MRTSPLGLAIVGCWLALSAALHAGQWRCPDCGCCDPPCRVKRLVPGVERVVHYEYFNRCETYCVQGPSRCVGEVRKTCADANNEVPQYDKIWQPICGPTFTSWRLCKRPVIEERPIMRCVMEDVCSRCNAAHAAREAHPSWASRKPRQQSEASLVAARTASATSGRGPVDQPDDQSLPVISDVPLGVSLPPNSPALGR